MQNNRNVISIREGAADRKGPFWSFNYPHQVVSDANLDLEEKRAILSAWASDEHTVDSLPTLRHLPGTPFPVTLSSIMAARVALDKMTGANDEEPSLDKNLGGSLRNGLIMALDRTGCLQTTRWSDVSRMRRSIAME